MKTIKYLFLIACFFFIAYEDDAKKSDDETDPSKGDTTITIQHLYNLDIGPNDEVYLSTDKGLLKKDASGWKLLKNAGTTDLSAYEIKDFVVQQNSTGIFLGTNSGLVALQSAADGLSDFKLYNKASGMVSDTVVSMALDVRVSNWIVTPEGLSLFKNNKWFKPSLYDYYSSNLFRKYKPTNIVVSRDTAYICAVGWGVVRYLEKADGVTGASELYPDYGCEVSDSTYVVFVDSKYKKWFGSNTGIVLHTGGDYFKGNSYENYLKYNKDSGLVDNRVRCFAEDKDGSIWIGTLGGVSKFQNNEFVSFNKSTGLASETITDIDVDSKGNIWALGNNTLSVCTNNTWSVVDISLIFKVPK